MSYKILPSDVGALLGKSDLTIREGMKRGYFDIGIAMQLPGSAKYNYTIFPAKVAELMGISVDELYKKLDEIRKEKRNGDTEKAVG